ncbi:3-hydroxybutyrate dehydrogenase [Enterobacter ludwigii]|uniref:3-hydroxybutyrate dehydrogenase n=1 Tax=Enterobacter ludwigii TaxID=299767 RepID=UPI0006435F0D|nr:3-hydroxybutyrate dehydrogenase [Enterobacter ludwigii]KLP39102.1 3-hydroxybutyrate dehydrogenase [Enterobacter ludwigii]
MKSLSGKTALVTGAGSGLGREIALLMASEGASVGIADLSLASAGKVVREIQLAGGEALAIGMDVPDEQQTQEGIDALVSRYGSLDILVSNAGIQIVSPLDEYPFADWRKMMAVHPDGAFLTTRAALKHMYKKPQGGTVIYIGSVHSHEASRLKAAYVTARHGLMGLAKVVAKEGAVHNVRSHVVCPGFVDTPLVKKQIPEQARELGISEEDVVKNIMLAETVDGQFTSAADIAETVRFLVTFPSMALTGQSITVSHGWGMR